MSGAQAITRLLDYLRFNLDNEEVNKGEQNTILKICSNAINYNDYKEAIEYVRKWQI